MGSSLFTSASCRMLLMVALGFIGAAPAQDSTPGSKPPALPTGTVTGRVYDAETNLPVRFAEIRLVPKPTDADLQPRKPLQLKPGESYTPPTRVVVVSGTSGLDGSFRLERVPAGDYLAGVIKAGYTVPAPSISTNATITPDELRALVTSLPVVHVAVDQTASVNLTARRGAVVSGRIRFADGSPAIEMKVGITRESASELQTPPRGWQASPFQQALSAFDDISGGSGVTDDEGRFRIIGLAPGKYILATSIVVDRNPAKVSTQGGGDLNDEHRTLFPEFISVYAPGVFRLADAKPIEVQKGEHALNADITIDTAGLHTIRCRVYAEGDGHAPNSIMVIVREEGKKATWRIAEAQHGSLQIDDVPPGNYTLEIMATDDTKTDRVFSYQHYKTARLSAVVAENDVDLGEIHVTPLKPGEVESYPEPQF